MAESPSATSPNRTRFDRQAARGSSLGRSSVSVELEDANGPCTRENRRPKWTCDRESRFPGRIRAGVLVGTEAPRNAASMRDPGTHVCP